MEQIPSRLECAQTPESQARIRELIEAELVECDKIFEHSLAKVFAACMAKIERIN